jgi:hypothetical protein
MAGADLRKRIESIIKNRIGQRLTTGRKILLTAAASLAVAGPVSVGMMDVTPMLRAQSGSGPTQTPTQGSRPEFEVASIKPSVIPPDGRVTVTMETQGGRFRATHEPLINLIAFAYNVHLFQISGAPNWVSSLENGYEIDAKARAAISKDESRRMLQSLLADRAGLGGCASGTRRSFRHVRQGRRAYWNKNVNGTANGCFIDEAGPACIEQDGHQWSF